MLPDFKIHYKVTAIKIVGTHIKIDVDQWNKIKNPEINTGIYI